MLHHEIEKSEINEYCKILVVDDSDFSRKIIVNALESSGINVVGEASNFKEAVDMIGKTDANLIITDIVMPDSNGIELIKELTDGFNERYFIVVSSLDQQRVIIECITAGAIDFIHKPFKNEQLIQSVIKGAHRIMENSG